MSGWYHLLNAHEFGELRMLVIEDETFGCHHQLDGHESEQVLGGGDGQESLGYCSFMGSQRVRHD